MKKKDFYRGLSLADDKYIAEADPNNVIKPKRSRTFVSLVAACACFALIFCNLWLFIPFRTTPPDVSKYSDSEYYGLIQKLNALTFEAPKYKNRAAKLFASIENAFLSFGAGSDMGMNGGSAPDNAGPTGDGGEYTEITDNQVEGIIEADRIKRSDTHIYYLDNEVLRVYEIAKEETKQVGSYTLLDTSAEHWLVNASQYEFYLSSDCKTVTVVTELYEKTGGKTNRYVSLMALDVSDPENIVKKQEFKISGAYMSSRMANGSILLLTEFAIDKKTLNFDDERTFLPEIRVDGEAYTVPADGIVSPDTLSNTRYTVVMKLDEGTLDLMGTAAYLSYSEEVYVSADHVFLTRVFADKKKADDGSYTRDAMTEITCLSYGGDTFESKGSVTVRGYVKDQWSMDEYEGILRVFTTTNTTKIREEDYTSNATVSSSILQTATGNSNASLYCIDLSTFDLVASVVDFAPPREEIQSVRFDKEMAYVCTSIELSDPVFFFDLSDLEQITYKDTGTIEGFSTSLINLGDGYLLGIGRGDGWNSLKVEVYEETEDGVRSVCAYARASAEYSTEYKSYYVDRENQLIGLGVSDYSYHDYTKVTRYILLHFDGYDLVELVNVPLCGELSSMRGVYIDGYMYMFGLSDFKVEKVFG